MHDYGIELPDRELVCAPFSSPQGQEYFSAMNCAANFAFANRQVLAHNIQRSFQQVLGNKVQKYDLHQIYDVCTTWRRSKSTELVGTACAFACTEKVQPARSVLAVLELLLNFRSLASQY